MKDNTQTVIRAEIASRISSTAQEAAIASIYADIANAAGRGQFSTTVHMPLVAPIRAELEAKGFTVTPVYRNPDYNNQTIVSWWMPEPGADQ